MPSTPTVTSFALLGLLGIQPWTAYELVEQVKRNLRLMWPRSEANLYAELKKIVERGHAETETVSGRRRQATRYTITPLGRTALEGWLATEPAAPVLEIEALLRLFFADQGTAEDLRASLEATKRQMGEWRARGLPVIEEHLATGGPFPERLHVIAPATHFYARFVRMFVEFCDETLTELETWPDIRNTGLTADSRERYRALVEEPEP